MQTSASLLRDANNVPIQTDGVLSTSIQTIIGNNTTVAVPIFNVTGTIECRGIYGIITTTLGANHTTAYFRVNDQTSQPAITLATGVTLSAKTAGSTIVKKGLAAAAAVLLDNAAGIVSEPTTLETAFFSPFVVVKKTAAKTDIEYVYSTTDTPTTGVIQFFLRWLPLSQDAAITPY